MRDTSDMMDAMSEDTVMDCGSDLDDLLDLAGDISGTAPTIQDAAERLLTLLGVDDESDNDFLSSSEDEGVDCDPDDCADEPEEHHDSRLLHQLASSLANELKYVHRQTTSISMHSQCQRLTQEHSMQSMDLGQDPDEATSRFIQLETPFPGQDSFTVHPRDDFVSNKRCKVDQRLEVQGSDDKTLDSSSWSAGWDACAAEAVRYLLEEEGLDPHHPTILTLKSHLEVQRNRALSHFSS